MPAHFREEAALALDNLLHVLKAAGAGTDQAVRTMCLLSDADDAAVSNEEYARILGDARPSRSTSVVDLPSGVHVEIEATAYNG